MIGAAALALIVAIALMLIRALSGPTLYDRVLAVNSLGTKIILLLGVIGFLTGRPDFLDISILYALINFVSLIAILKFFRYRTLSVSMLGAAADAPEFVENRETPTAELEATPAAGAEPAPIKPGGGA